MNDAILSSVETLYSELPEVNCRGCGGCCVSPTCTLSEFLYLMNYLENNLDRTSIHRFLCTPPELHPEYPYNIRCVFLDRGRCLVHEGRTGACRLFGVPALSEMHIEELVTCKNSIELKQGRGDLEYIQTWLRKLVDLNDQLYPYGHGPYFIRGFNITCWLDLYFDSTIVAEQFVSLQKVLRDAISLDWLSDSYRPASGLKDKIDKITLLDLLIENGDREMLRGLLVSIRDGYPLTGSYFFEEAQEFLKQLDTSVIRDCNA